MRVGLLPLPPSGPAGPVSGSGLADDAVAAASAAALVRTFSGMDTPPPTPILLFLVRLLVLVLVLVVLVLVAAAGWLSSAQWVGEGARLAFLAFRPDVVGSAAADFLAAADGAGGGEDDRRLLVLATSTHGSFLSTISMGSVLRAMSLRT